MFDHVELKVADLEQSKRFYSIVLAPLGISLTYDTPSTAEFGALGLVQATRSDPIHLAFIAETREEVEEKGPVSRP